MTRRSRLRWDAKRLQGRMITATYDTENTPPAPISHTKARAASSAEWNFRTRFNKHRESPHFLRVQALALGAVSHSSSVTMPKPRRKELQKALHLHDWSTRARLRHQILLPGLCISSVAFTPPRVKKLCGSNDVKTTVGPGPGPGLVWIPPICSRFYGCGTPANTNTP